MSVAALFGRILPLVPGIEARLADGLDKACGSGRAVIAFAHAVPASRFTGRDVSAEAVASSTSLASLQRLPAVRFVQGEVAPHWAEIRNAAAERSVWIVGGGDLAGQFADADLLTEIRVSIAPATLPSGRPLLPRRIGPDRLRLEGMTRAGQFAELRYSVSPA